MPESRPKLRIVGDVSKRGGRLQRTVEWWWDFALLPLRMLVVVMRPRRRFRA